MQHDLRIQKQKSLTRADESDIGQDRGSDMSFWEEGKIYERQRSKGTIREGGTKRTERAKRERE